MKKIIFFMVFIFMMFSTVFILTAEIVTNLNFDIPANPKYKPLMSVEEILRFYENSDTGILLDKNENDIVPAKVSLNGKNYECNLYIRTFSLSNPVGLASDQMDAALNSNLNILFDGVSKSILKKYISTVSYSIGANASIAGDNINGITEMIVSFAIAVSPDIDEFNEKVVENFIKPKIAEWKNLSIPEKINELNKFLLNGQFKYDMELKNNKSTVKFLDTKEGVCEDYSGLTCLFLNEMGLENILISGLALNSAGTSDNHSWNMVMIDNNWYHLDILWNGPTDKEGNHTSVITDYLLKSTEAISNNHFPFDMYDEYTKAANINFVLPIPIQNEPEVIKEDIIKEEIPIPEIEKPEVQKPQTEPPAPMSEKPEIPKPDKTRLIQIINDYTKLNLQKEDYKPDSWEVFEKALLNAKNINSNANSLELDINKAINELKGSYYLLEIIKKVDKTKLNALLTETIEKGKYLPSSLTGYEIALQQGKAISENPEVSTEQVLATEAAIISAKNKLVLMPDKNILEIYINTLEDLLTNDQTYTQESIVTLNSAILQIKEIYENKDSKEEDIKAAIAEYDRATKSIKPYIEKSSNKPENLDLDQVLLFTGISAVALILIISSVLMIRKAKSK